MALRNWRLLRNHDFASGFARFQQVQRLDGFAQGESVADMGLDAPRAMPVEKRAQAVRESRRVEFGIGRDVEANDVDIFDQEVVGFQHRQITAGKADEDVSALGAQMTGGGGAIDTPNRVIDGVERGEGDEIFAKGRIAAVEGVICACASGDLQTVRSARDRNDFCAKRVADFHRCEPGTSGGTKDDKCFALFKTGATGKGEMCRGVGDLKGGSGGRVDGRWQAKCAIRVDNCKFSQTAMPDKCGDAVSDGM